MNPHGGVSHMAADQQDRLPDPVSPFSSCSQNLKTCSGAPDGPTATSSTLRPGEPEEEEAGRVGGQHKRVPEQGEAERAGEAQSGVPDLLAAAEAEMGPGGEALVVAPLTVGSSSSSSGGAPVGVPEVPEPAQAAESESPDGAPEDAAEEAVSARPLPSPSDPTEEEKETHAATHLPYRSWCPSCVSGRRDNPGHYRVPEDPLKGRVPEVHLDYCYLRRASEEHTVTVLVVKDRWSRAVRAWVMRRKGRPGRGFTSRPAGRGGRCQGIRA